MCLPVRPPGSRASTHLSARPKSALKGVQARERDVLLALDILPSLEGAGLYGHEYLGAVFGSNQAPRGSVSPRCLLFVASSLYIHGVSSRIVGLLMWWRWAGRRSRLLGICAAWLRACRATGRQVEVSRQVEGSESESERARRGHLDGRLKPHGTHQLRGVSVMVVRGASASAACGPCERRRAQLSQCSVALRLRSFPSTCRFRTSTF